MPPFLTLTLEHGSDGWQVTDLTLYRTSTAPPALFGPGAMQVLTDSNLSFTIEGDALRPGGQLEPFQLDVTLRSP